MLILVSGDSIDVDHGLIGSGEILLTAGRGTALNRANDAGWKPNAFPLLSKMPVLGPGSLRAINTLDFTVGGIAVGAGSANISTCKAFRLA